MTAVLGTRLQIGCYNDSLNTDGPQQFATWLGAPPDVDLLFTGQADDSDYKGSVNYAIGLQRWSGPKMISMPLMYTGVTLAQCVSGVMDADWTADLQTILSDLADQPIIYLRGPWEFNGNWEIWQSVPGQESVFVAAWQRWASLVRKLDTKNQCRLVWCWNIGWNDPTPSYPGDAYVDVMGPDIYWNAGEPTDFASLMLNAQYGLAWGLAFSEAHGGQPLCIPELGLGSNDLAQCTTDLFAWAVAKKMTFINLWNSDVAYAPGGQLSAGLFPATGAAFKAAALAIINGTASAPVAPPASVTPAAAPVVAATTPTVTVGADMSLTLSSPLAAGTYKLVPVGPLVINLSEDAYQGDAIAAIELDGKPLPDVTVTAIHGKGTQPVLLGDVDLTVPHSYTVTFVNDNFGGSSTTDRNLYLDSHTLNGAPAVTSCAAALMSNGSTTTVEVPVPA